MQINGLMSPPLNLFEINKSLSAHDTAFRSILASISPQIHARTDPQPWSCRLRVDIFLKVCCDLKCFSAEAGSGLEGLCTSLQLYGEKQSRDEKSGNN